MGTREEDFALVDLLFKAIEAGDVATIRDEVYTEDTVVWHNFDNVDQSAADNLKLLEQVVASIRDLRYTDIRRYPIEGGVVQQHVLRGVVANGELAMPASMFVWIEGGRIARIEEYLDSSQLSKLGQG